MSGYVTFQAAGRELGCRLAEVREVVRAHGIESLPGLVPPVTGLLLLRGAPLPIVDLRAGHQSNTVDESAYGGDVLVLVPDGGGAFGVAVDRVLGVHAAENLVAQQGVDLPLGLPAYVSDVRYRSDGAPVLVVSLRAMAGLDTAATTGSLATGAAVAAAGR
jgi:chemotaxis signal transduction protein